MKFKLTNLIKEVIEEIVKTNRLSDPENYVLLLPPASPDSNSIWLDETKFLSHYPLQAKDLLELRNKYQVIKIRFRGVNERLLVDVNQPIGSIMPLIAKKFQLENMAEYNLRLKKKEIAMDKSVREQQISTDATYFLKSGKEEILEEEEEAPAKIEDDEKEEEQEEAIDIQTANPKTIKNPNKVGFVNVKQGKKKKFDQRWLILKNKYLFIFKTQNDKKPSEVLQLDQFKVKLYESTDEKEKKTKEYQFTFELEKEKEEPFFFKCDNENHLTSWLTMVRNVIDNTALAYTDTNIFGAPIHKVCPPGTFVPEVIDQCAKYIQEKALDTVGIFRLSGSAVSINEYKKAINRGEKIDLSKESDPHAVSGLLKLYFRELPEPILTFQYYDQFIAAQCIPNQNLRVRYLKNLIQALPKINLEVLRVLFSLLVKVQEHSAVNKMGIPNLATVFGPNLLVSPDRSTLQMVQDTPVINGIVSNLIQHYDNIILGREMEEILATVLYEYKAVDPVELNLMPGQIIKVLHQGEDGWWQGELEGAIGQFPGSYVKIEVKSKREQYKEEMKNAKTKLKEEKNAVTALRHSKSALKKEIEELKLEKQNFEKDIQALKQSMIQMLSRERLDGFVPKLDNYHKKMKEIVQLRTKEEECRKNFVEELASLNTFLKNPPDPKKIKGKAQEKIESQIGLLQIKMNTERRKRVVVNERMDDLFKDLHYLNHLLLPM
eukprot:TRINITY_DN4314_c0_g2_i1.p1 TRINITY_DN4314_c0_g2~~TRINITY_DN4314_c0_g2_i1.p1  ORF type:complete len:766 (-),score=242.13 TRINITY_DN4314_c0_g2_i1:1027-3177(-)